MVSIRSKKMPIQDGSAKRTAGWPGTWQHHGGAACEAEDQALSSGCPESSPAAKRSVTPTLVYHARVLATAVAKLRPSALPAARRLAASVARCLFVLKRRAGVRWGAAVRQWKAALHTQKLSGIRLASMACAIRRLIQSAELKKRRVAYRLASFITRGKLGRYAAGKRLLLAARRLLERKKRIEREVNQMGSQFLMDMNRSKLSDPAFRRQVRKSLLHGEDVVEDEIESTYCMVHLQIVAS